ncbi:hypothetical protein SMD44_07955 [Streptomyces alboflavus]|uniref:Lipoprotein n=1 Tax=Streptomyces alboflavus TaxID=67267 RepID=A0A1Z1WPV8_9ACTN|nr:hypothetical protein [Streptomyces alboflavus]ARX88468.1 hypothetical protein SMD44_07955 [Streptomyces alboflavus]
MHIRPALRLCLAIAATAGLLVGCADKDGSRDERGEKKPAAQPPASRSSQDTSSGRTRNWEPDDALQRAERALDAYEDDGTHPELVDTDTSYIASGLTKTYNAPGDRPYRLDITCNTDDIEELTLTLTRGDEEQPYGIGCGDPEADQFNIPPGKPFKISAEPVKDSAGLFLWRLNTIASDDVEGCEDDIKAC